DKDQNRVKLRFNPTQLAFHQNRSNRDIVLKPRQKGISTYVLADYFRMAITQTVRSEEHTSELQSRENLVCRLLLEKKKIQMRRTWYSSLKSSLSPGLRSARRMTMMHTVRSVWPMATYIQ